MKLSYSSAPLAFLFLFFLVSCGKDDDTPEPLYSNLVESELVSGQSASQLNAYLQISGIDISPVDLLYNVEIYRVVYETTYKGSTINASGLVILPLTTEDVGMVSFQHGTIASNGEAPSNQTGTSLVLYSTLASPGFVAVVPDFIGFGESNNLLHPYYIKEATSTAVIDNIKAAYQLAEEKNIHLNGNLFLAGYSQGGYATMATHQALEESPLEGLDLKASFPSSGGYDTKGMQEYFFGLETYDEPFFLAYVALAYQQYYEWANLLTEFFNPPYAQRIPSLFDGSKGGSQINSQLTTDISDLVKAEVIADIDSDEKYQELVDAFNSNSLLDWTPTRRIMMFHGDADITVPYQNSVDTYHRLIENGTSTSTLTLTTLSGSTHYTGAIPYIEQFVPSMVEMNKNE